MKIFRQTDKKLLIVNLLLILFIVLLLTDGISPVLAGGTSDFRQYHYNFRTDDDGLNVETSWLGTDDNPSSDLVKGITYRVRFNVAQVGTKKYAKSETLEYGTQSDCTSGSWTPVPVTVAAGEHFEMVASVQYANGARTDTRLLGVADPEPTWIDGYGVADPSNVAASIQYNEDQFTEHEYAFTPTTNANDGVTYYMRLDNIEVYNVCAEFSMEPPPAGQTISGRVFTAEGGGAGLDCDPTSSTITLLVNGASPTSVGCTDSPSQGSYEFTGITTNATDILTVYVNEDGAGIFGTVVTETAGNDITDLDIYGDHIIVRHDNSGALTIDDMDNYDSGNDTDIHFTATNDTPDTLTVDDGEELYIWGGDTFAPGGNLTAIDDIQIEGIYTAAGSETITVSGDWLNNSTFTAASSTITMDGTGTFTSGGSSVNNLTLSGSGTITLANATHIIAGNLNMTGDTIIPGSSTVTMTGTLNTIVGGGNTLNILDINPSSAGTITLQTSDLTVGSTLTVAAGDELAITTVNLTHTDASDVDGTGTISGTGTLIFDDGSGGPGSDAGVTLSSVVRFDASAGNITTGTFDARTYSGQVEMYSGAGAGAARSVAMAASTYTISGASSHLYLINNNDTYTLTLDGALNPTVNIEGDLDFTGTGASSELLTTGTGTWTVTGNINLTDGDVTFTTGTPDNTFQVNGTSKTITSDGKIFQNLSVTGTGDVSNVDLLTVAADFSIGASANFSHGNNVNFLSTGTGDTAFVITNGGTFDSTGAGTGKLILDGADASFDDQTDPGEQNMGDVQIGQSPGTTKLKSDFAADSLTILDGDKFETHGWEVDIVGAIDCQLACTFDLQDDAPNADADPTTVTFGGDWTMSGTAEFIPFTNSVVSPDGSVDQAVATGDKAFWDFYSNNSAGDADDDVIISGAFTIDGDLTVNDGELDLNTNNPATDVEGDIIMNVGGELNAPGSLSAAGSWNNNGAFTANAGTVTFDSDDAATIDAGGSAQPFNIVIFDNAAGSWTIQNDDMTTNGNLTLTAATAFSVLNVTLEVKGNFTLTVSGVNTTWTGSTLYLNGSGGMWEINTKSHGGDAFATLKVGTTEDIAMWDSSAGAYTIEAGGCLYSQDHGGVTPGRLNIYGDCYSRTNEYWSYAKDFNGDAVSRQADVRLAPAASYTVDSVDTLEIKGQNASSNRSLVTRDSTGNYSMTIDGTIDAQYYDFDYMDASGLNITSTATVTELSDGNFDNNSAGGAYITVTNINSTDEFRNNVFNDDGNVDYNVNADGLNIYWKFLLWSGSKGGEVYDLEANNAVVDWSENLGFVLSANVMNLGVINPLVIGTDSHNLTVTTNATNGYSCYAEEDGELRSGTDDIDGVLDNTVDAGQEEYGISCSGGGCQLGANDEELSDTPLLVAFNAGRVTAEATTVTYKAAADGTTVGTSYSHEVTFTCTGDF